MALQFQGRFNPVRADNRPSIEDPLHNITRFTYNHARQVLTVRDARDKLTINEYVAAQEFWSSGRQ